MMGQKRRKAEAALAEEREAREQAGFGNPDDEKKVSYLPDSIHGSPRHMAALAKNALTLVSEYGCPHVFLTLTCNPKWEEIQCQLLKGQSAYDRPDIVCVVFKSRLDQFKHNLRAGKYFKGATIVYILHVIEYQFRGMPHAHIVFRLEKGIDIDDDTESLIDFVNKYFIAEMPRFAGEENQNVFQDDGELQFDAMYRKKRWN